MDTSLLKTNDPIFFTELINKLISNVNTAIPGIIQSFNVETQRVMVKPALRYLKIDENLERKYLELPLLTEVPIVLPYSTSTGFCLTFPIVEGDECLMVFSQRAMDGWQTQGGIQNVVGEGDCRKYDLSDAIAIPGLFSNPNAIQNYQNDGIELRNKDRSCFLKVLENSINANVSNGSLVSQIEISKNGFIKISSGEKTSIEIDGNGSIVTITAENILLNGTVSGNSNGIPITTSKGIMCNGKIIDDAHRHEGVQGGNSQSGGVA